MVYFSCKQGGIAMVFSGRLLIITLEALMIAGGGVSVVLRRKDKTAAKFTVENPKGFDVFFFIVGILFSLLTFLVRDPAASWFCIFSFPSLYAALVTANQRIRWDTEGFWYRTAFRREIRYDFADVRRMRPVGRGHIGPDLFVNVNGRRFLLDEITFWQRFTGAYNDWRTRNRLPTWDQERRERFLEKYRRHGPFRKKLDRIPSGRLILWLSLVFGGLIGTLSIFFIIGMMIGEIKASPITCICAAAGLFFSIKAPAQYLYAVAHLDDKPHLIRRCVNGKILPDPDRPKPQKKVYRKK